MSKFVSLSGKVKKMPKKSGGVLTHSPNPKAKIKNKNGIYQKKLVNRVVNITGKLEYIRDQIRMLKAKKSPGYMDRVRELMADGNRIAGRIIWKSAAK